MTQMCKACNAPLCGEYCQQCGQKLIKREDRTLKHLLYEAFHNLTDVDGKILRTSRTLILHPGRVTKEISEGITVRYTKLSSIFLIVIFAYFLVPTDLHTFLNPAYEWSIVSWAEKYKDYTVDGVIKKTGTDRKTIETNYNRRGNDVGRLVAIFLPPLVIPIFWLINLTIGFTKSNHTFTAFDLATASFEIINIFLLTVAILRTIDLLLKLTGVPNNSLIATVSTLCLFVASIYLHFRFFREAYGLRRGPASLCVAVYFIWFYFMLDVYYLIYFGIVIRFQ